MNKIMKRTLIVLFTIICAQTASAQSFDNYFTNKTMRLDYIFSGNKQIQMVALDEISQWDGWAGRRHNLGEMFLRGNGSVTVRSQSGETIYCSSFSSLFQEWLVENESERLTKSFEATFLIPYPKEPVDVTIELLDSYGHPTASLTHTVDPKDILIRDLSAQKPSDSEIMIHGGSSAECIDIAIVGEGYTASEQELFIEDAKLTCKAIFEMEPYKSNAEHFNIIAVNAISKDTDVSIPHEKRWLQTAMASTYDTFYSERYLTTNHVHQMHDLLAGLPYEHIIVIANTDTYGGGGIFNSYAMSTAHNSYFEQVVVHEFGHSFAGLGDEYFYDHDDIATGSYPADTEPWEPNITTLHDFDSKWKEMLPASTQVPTPVTDKAREAYTVGVYEGGGYVSKGVYRPAVDCRMRTNTAPVFCPVCQKAIQRAIDFYTE